MIQEHEREGEKARGEGRKKSKEEGRRGERMGWGGVGRGGGRVGERRKVWTANRVSRCKPAYPWEVTACVMRTHACGKLFTAATHTHTHTPTLPPMYSSSHMLILTPILILHPLT